MLSIHASFDAGAQIFVSSLWWYVGRIISLVENSIVIKVKKILMFKQIHRIDVSSAPELKEFR